jgi:hypothetical protein
MDGVRDRAMRLAIAGGNPVTGEEHLLLAALEALAADATTVEGLRAALGAGSASEAEGAGAGAEGAGTEAEGAGAAGPAVRRWTRSGPGYHRSSGRAHGLALAAERASPTAADHLAACLWEPDGPAARVLASLGVESTVRPPAGPRPVARTVIGDALGEAVALGDGFVGDGHLVLAVLAGRPDPTAREALAECGITRAAYEARHVEWLASVEPPASRLAPGSTPALNPACHQTVGRAEGLAAGRGQHTVDSTTLVVAWLWQDHGASVLEAEALGTTAVDLLGALSARGMTLPPVATLPEPDRRPWGPTVYFPADRLDDVLARLNRDLPAGDWGWNRHGDRAWADAVAGINLAAIVADALGDGPSQPQSRA